MRVESERIKHPYILNNHPTPCQKAHRGRGVGAKTPLRESEKGANLPPPEDPYAAFRAFWRADSSGKVASETVSQRMWQPVPSP